MKKILFLAIFLAAGSMSRAEQVVIQTKNTTMVLDVTNSLSMFIMVRV